MSQYQAKQTSGFSLTQILVCKAIGILMVDYLEESLVAALP